MSADSIQRIYDRHAADIPAACAAGRGKDLHDSMIRDLAVDYANTVFLKIETEVSQATEDTIADVYEWAKQYPHTAGLSFVESVSATLQAFGANDTQRAEAETLAANAYRDQIYMLFDRAEAGVVA